MTLWQKAWLFFLLCCSLNVPTLRADTCELDCVFENSWAVGVGLGFGEYTNPLHDGKDRNVAVLPSFYYYGEKFYIENTEIGYVFAETYDYALKVKGKFNKDGLYFNESAFDGLIISGLFGPGNFVDPEDVSVDEVDRKLSYMAGFAGDYYLTNNWTLSGGIYHDVTGVHHGYTASGGIRYYWKQKDWSFHFSAGAEYLSREVNNYYYGLRPEDETAFASFEVAANVNYLASASLVYRINEHFSLVSSYYYEKLGDKMTVSPLVEEDSASFYFLGISAQFGSNN